MGLAPILVVDDESEMRSALSHALTRDGFTVESAASGMKALSKIKKDPVSLVITDLKMPDMDGLSLLRTVRERYPELKSDANFRDLQAQLEGTENRITVARNRYIDTVRQYNTLARSFPTNITAMLFGFEVKPSFTVENEAEIARPPEVSFGSDS